MIAGDPDVAGKGEFDSAGAHVTVQAGDDDLRQRFDRIEGFVGQPISRRTSSLASCPRNAGVRIPIEKHSVPSAVSVRTWISGFAARSWRWSAVPAADRGTKGSVRRVD